MDTKEIIITKFLIYEVVTHLKNVNMYNYLKIFKNL